jgi:dihydrofolate reductase
MGTIVISNNISLDGVIEDPTGEEDLGRGSWFASIADKDREAWAKVEFEEALGAEAVLLGRHTYAWLIKRGWPARTGEWADRLRSLPKHVVTATALDGPAWENSAALHGDVVAGVTALKERVAGEIDVYGSGRLAQTLIEHDLVDEVRLMTYPVVVGAGTRLFGETSALKSMRLVDTRVVGDGLVLLTYRFVGGARRQP